MKKIISVLVMVFLLCAFSASAFGAQTMTITTESKTAKPGDTVTVAVTVANNPGFCYLRMTPVYNADALELVGCSNGNVSTDSFSKGLNYLWDSEIDATANGTLCTFTFKVKDSASNGSYAVGFTFKECYNYNLEDVSVNVTNGAITVNAHTHSFTVKNTNSSYLKSGATCKTAAEYYYSCSCGEKGTTTFFSGNTTEHTWNSGTVTKKATCKETGVKTFTCTVCGTTKTETIAMSTSHSWGSGTVTKAATCKAKGEKKYTCSVCGTTKTEEIAINQNAHQWGAYTVVKEPTATENGQKQRKCSLCGKTESVVISNTTVKLAYDMDDDILSVNFVNAVGLESWNLTITYDTKVFDGVHSAEAGADAREVANTKDNIVNVSGGINAESAGTIVFCGYFFESLWTAEEFAANAKKNKTVNVNATDFEAILFYMLENEEYDFSEGEITVTVSGSFSMNDDSKVQVADTLVLHQHQFGNPIIVKPATCKAVGIRKLVCSCGEEKTEEIPKLSTHTWGAWKAVRRPTATERGAMSHTCTVCGTTEQQVIPTTNSTRKVALSYDYAQDVLKVNFMDAVGLKSWDLKITYDSDIIAGVDSFESGADAVKVNNTKNNSVNVTDGINTSVDGEILASGYFKEKMWTSEEFAADAKTGKDASVHAENFETLLLNLLKQDGVLLTQKQSVIRIEGEFAFDSGIVNVSDSLIIGCVSPNHSGGTEIINAKEATYRETGYTGDTYCLGCGAKLKNGEVIPALVKMGDVDNDGRISAADARLALRASVHLENFDERQTVAADVDKNGSITAADARLILRASVNLEDSTKW